MAKPEETFFEEYGDDRIVLRADDKVVYDGPRDKAPGWENSFPVQDGWTPQDTDHARRPQSVVVAPDHESAPLSRWVWVMVASMLFVIGVAVGSILSLLWRATW